MDAVQRQLLSDLGVNLSTQEVFGMGVTFYRIAGGSDAVKLWHRLRGPLAQLGAWPIICGNCEQLDYVKEAIERHGGTSIEEMLARVPTCRPLDALRADEEEQRRRMLAWMDEHDPALAASHRAFAREAERLCAEISQTAGESAPVEWPATPTEIDREPYSVFDLERRPCECILAIVPTLEPAATPLYLAFGSFNSCPPPELHVAFLRDWHRRFGALPICITHDVIELFVPEPPMTRAAALSLAQEQEQYASDILCQGTETVGQLAVQLWQSPYWFFWWD